MSQVPSNNGGNHDAASGQNTNGQHVNDSNSATTGSPALNTTFNTEGTQPMMAGQRQPSITAASNRTMATRMSNAFTTFATQNVSGGNTTPGVAAANTAVPVANTAALRQHIMTIQERINRAHQVLQHPGSNEATRQHAQNVIQESTSYLTVLLRKVQEMQMNQPQSNVNAASTSTPGSTTPATSGVNMPATSAGNKAKPPSKGKKGSGTTQTTTATTSQSATSPTTTSVPSSTAASAISSKSNKPPVSGKGKGAGVSAITTTTATSVPSNTSTLPGTPSATSLSKTASAGLSSTRSPSVKPPASLQRTISSTGNASSGSMPPTPRATAPPSAGLSTPLGIGTRSVNSAGSGILTQTYGGTLDATSTTMASILPKRKLQELVTQIDPNERLDPDVEDILLEVADEFIESVTAFACRLAKHRKSDTLEVKDLQLHLERNWNIRIPGFATDEIRPSRKPVVVDAHRQRLAAINAAKSARRTTDTLSGTNNQAS